YSRHTGLSTLSLHDALPIWEKKIYAVTFDTMLHPFCDLETARKVAGEAGVIHEVIYLNELEQAEIRFNPVNRCYLCKKALFQRRSEEHTSELQSVSISYAVF